MLNVMLALCILVWALERPHFIKQFLCSTSGSLVDANVGVSIISSYLLGLFANKSLSFVHLVCVPYLCWFLQEVTKAYRGVTILKV